MLKQVQLALKSDLITKINQICLENIEDSNLFINHSTDLANSSLQRDKDMWNQVETSFSQEEQCCFDNQAKLDSLQETLTNLGDNNTSFPLKHFFKAATLWTFIGITGDLFHGILISSLLAFVFGLIYLSGRSYLVYYNQKARKTTLVDLLCFCGASVACFCSSFVIPSAWLIFFGYSRYVPKKLSIFELFEKIPESCFPSNKFIFLNNSIFNFLFTKIIKFLPLLYHGAFTVIGLWY